MGNIAQGNIWGNIGKYRSGKHRETYRFPYEFCSIFLAAISYSHKIGSLFNLPIKLVIK